MSGTQSPIWSPCRIPTPGLYKNITLVVKVLRLRSSSLLPLPVRYKIMENMYYIGIDISKKKLDICVLSSQGVLKEITVANHQQAIICQMKEIIEEFGMAEGGFVVCAEHTGQYGYPLRRACDVLGCTLWMENPAQIKYSIGMTRGKNDRIDARRIAGYARRFSDRLRPFKSLPHELERLKHLEAERSLYLNDLSKYNAQMSDQKEFLPEDVCRRKAGRMAPLIRALKLSIKSIEDEMSGIISRSEKLSRQMELLKSVDGVGPVVALNMIVATEAFSRFDNARQFCCYAGVAPFAYTSGSSLHSRSRVSKRAAKRIKSLLHMAAVSVARRKDGQLKEYFLRKVAEGKNKMTVINAVRAKLVARMFAVIKNNQFYQPILS